MLLNKYELEILNILYEGKTETLYSNGDTPIKAFEKLVRYKLVVEPITVPEIINNKYTTIFIQSYKLGSGATVIYGNPTVKGRWVAFKNINLS